MDEQVAVMLETLKDSVVGIAEAPAAERGELLSKSFEEFAAEIGPMLKAESAGGTDELLFKGLGCVGRIGNLLGSIAGQVQAIKDGKDQWGPSDSKVDPDPCSDVAAMYLDRAVTLVTLALRATVNEHVEDVEDDEDEDEGFHYVRVPNADSPDDDDTAIVVKTQLPEDLAKFATDPGHFYVAAATLGAEFLVESGVPEASLEKLFDGGLEPMAKDGDLELGDTPGADAAEDAVEDGDDVDPNDLAGQVEILGRIQAAALMQLEHVMQLVEGGSAGGDAGDTIDAGADAGGGDADAAAAAAADPADDAGADDGTSTSDEATDPGKQGDKGTPPKDEKDDETDPGKKRPPFGKSADGDEVAELRKQLTAAQAERDETARLAQELLKKHADAPVAPKAVLMKAVSKEAETGGDAVSPRVALAKAYAAAPTDEAKRTVLLRAAFNPLTKGATAAEMDELAKSL